MSPYSHESQVLGAVLLPPAVAVAAADGSSVGHIRRPCRPDSPPRFWTLVVNRAAPRRVSRSRLWPAFGRLARSLVNVNSYVAAVDQLTNAYRRRLATDD